TERLAAVCAGQSSRFKIPVLGNVGTPLGVDVRKVAELGTTPAVTTGILHRSAGTGQVGAGVAEAPLACFADALTDLDRRLTGPDRRRTVRGCRAAALPGHGHRPPRHIKGTSPAPEGHPTRTGDVRGAPRTRTCRVRGAPHVNGQLPPYPAKAWNSATRTVPACGLAGGPAAPPPWAAAPPPPPPPAPPPPPSH